jgi:hypothetical protein
VTVALEKETKQETKENDKEREEEEYKKFYVDSDVVELRATCI